MQRFKVIPYSLYGVEYFLYIYKKKKQLWQFRDRPTGGIK